MLWPSIGSEPKAATRENAMPNVLITGANRGLGLEFARQYLAAGWEVYAACRNPASASDLRQLATDSGGRLRILAMDVTEAGASRRRQLNSRGKLSISYSTTLALSDRAAKRSETSITMRGRRCRSQHDGTCAGVGRICRACGT